MKKLISLALALIMLVSAMPMALAGADDNSMTVILGAEFSTLDPLALPSSPEINFCTNIFDSLVKVDKDLNIIPCLATDWTVSDDGLTYTFNLRQGVKFHNGNDFTAEDVKLSIDRFRDETWMQFASFAVDSCEVVDDYTVTVKLKYAYGAFLSMLWYCAIIDSDYYAACTPDAFARNPVGTGAYKFVKWDAAQQVVLEANESYWDTPAQIKTLIFKFVTDSNQAYIAVENGEADFYFNVSATDFLRAQQDGVLGTATCRGNYFYFASFNADVISKEVRQALMYAVDRDVLNVFVNEGTGIVGDLPLVEGQEGYTTDIKTYEYNPEKAKELLAAAGAEGLTLNYYYAENSLNKKLGEALQALFSQVGVTLELNPVESGTWWATFDTEPYGMSRGGYPMEKANTDSCYYDMFHGENGTFNVAHIKNDEIDALLDQARVELDSSARNDLYIKVNQILAEEAYNIPLFFTASFVVYNPALKGVEAITDSNYQYKEFHW
ncbi:MAG: ABC transporter substrate-binding protein [Clostridiales bacterium]|nr:ABC transporter substrate-binding protein [Clostridiales bacterium]